MLVDEARHEEIRMVITMMHAQRQLLSRILARLLQQFWLQLFNKERIGQTLIDKDVVEVSVRQTLTEQLARIMSAPCCAIVSRGRRLRIRASQLRRSRPPLSLLSPRSSSR